MKSKISSDFLIFGTVLAPLATFGLVVGLVKASQRKRWKA
jgi:hypothetical protein